MTRGPDALFDFDRVSLAGPHGLRLDAVSLLMPPEGVTAVVGPSGAGKSTLLRLCNRLDIPDSGIVRFRGVDVAHVDPVQHRRRVGMVFQRPTPFDGTVLDNLRAGAPSLSRHDCIALLSRARLDAGFLERDARRLSGGEAQRMCIARALATEPEVLLLDEPTAALDAEPRLALERLVCDLVAGGLPAVWVTHDLAQMRRVADHVIVLLDGHVAHCGDKAEIAAGSVDAPPAVVSFLEEMHDD